MEKVTACGNALDRYAVGELLNANDALVGVKLVHEFVVFEIFEGRNEIFHGELLDSLQLGLQLSLVLFVVFIAAIAFLLSLLPALEGTHELADALHAHLVIVPLTALFITIVILVGILIIVALILAIAGRPASV